jgi:tetratricopeptide (TPR) repeat protein
VESCPIQHDDDIVTLRLIDGPAPRGPEQIAVLGKAENSETHGFLSYGYSPILEYRATRADGRILGSVEPPAGKILHADPIQISSQQIDHGMSGAAVLDTEINLVIGLIAARNFPKSWLKADIAYAVDTKVLTFDPFCFALREEALPLRPAPLIRIDVPKATASVQKKLYPAWNNAPPSITEWVGRVDLLKAITNNWIDLKEHVTGLIGFGGEGKSSLARRWIDDLLKDTTSPQPDGIFWWGFYDRPSVDEFFESALNYLSGGNIELTRRYPSSSARVHLLAGMLYGGRYLFILDGLEGLQNQEGDQFGLLKNNDLREFLQFFASPTHNSFCLVTSRVPLLDMMEYTTYQHHDVERLSAADGRALLKKLGVKGTDAELDKVVADWDGHALTLSLIGSYIADQYGGDISHIKDLPTPTAGEPRYKRVHRILMRYDEHLSDEEKAFLKIFSAFRIPVDKTAVDDVFRAKPKEEPDKPIAINTSIVALDESAFEEMVKRLADYRILRYDLRTGKCNTHPLIRSHYYDLLLTGDHSQAVDVHRLLKEYYLVQAEDMQDNPTLDDLKPLIEAVHHACQSGSYYDALIILWERIYRRNEFYLYGKLGAYETDLAILQEFFPDGDTFQDPLVSSPDCMSWILSETGNCFMGVGLLEMVEQFLERANFILLNITKDRYNASKSYQNLSDLYASQGKLDRSIEAGRIALKLSIHAEDKAYECYSNAHQAFAEHLRGDLVAASEDFKKAEILEQVINHTIYLLGYRGIQHADHLIRIGNPAYAREVTKVNLAISEVDQWLNIISRCHRMLGDLDVNDEDHNNARKHYYEAIKIAREITYRQVLIEALLARGKWAAKHLKIAREAFSDLEEALNYATTGGFRILEADIRIALAWAHLAAGDKKKARAEALYAKQMSEEMSYYWGKKDADEVLAEIEKASL